MLVLYWNGIHFHWKIRVQNTPEIIFFKNIALNEKKTS